MKRHPMKLVLFDIDGTLLTSIGAGRNAVKESMERVCDQEILIEGVQFAGRTDPAILRDLLLVNGFSDERARELLDDCLAAYTSVLMRHLTPSGVHIYPGVRDLVRKMAVDENVVLGLLTGNLRDTAYLKLHAAGLGSYVAFGAFGSDRELRNELPAVAATRAFEHTGLSFKPEKMFIIGDTPHDFECGRSHGAHCIGVSTGLFSHEELATHGPDLLMEDFSDPAALYAYIDDSSNPLTNASTSA
jgi:phosphoglycolate phosphatase